MNTEQFLDLILPASGKRVVIAIGTKGPRQSYHDDNTTAAAAIAKLDKITTQNVYHACATYTDDKSRTASNVHSIKSFWLDLDCGPTKAYASQEDALAALELFLKQSNLPNPYIISSGVGLHVYWPLELDVTPVQWLPVAQLLKSVTARADLHAGPERTADMASILRPVGSTHRKAQPIKVDLHTAGMVVGFDYFRKTLEAFAATLGVDVDDDLGPAPSHVVFENTNADLVQVVDYGPPPLIDPIVEGCAIIREFRDSNGVIEEPLWRACLGVVKHCENGEAIGQDWSNGHPQYTHAATQIKMDSIKGGPTSCATLGAHRPQLCAACPSNGKIKSPIAIARAAAVVVAAIPNPVSPGTALPVPTLPNHFRYVQGQFWSGIEAEVFNKADNSTDWQRMLSLLMYPIAKVVDRKGGHSLIMRAHVTVSSVVDFELPLALISDTNNLLKLLGSREILPEPGMSKHLQVYIQRWMENQRTQALATQAYERFGWHGKEFLLGSTLYCSDGTEKTVPLTGSAQSLVKDFTPQGDLQVWKDTVDRAYNHKGVEDLQFAILAGMAAPLVRMFNDYGGMVVYLHSGDSGKGKTTIERAALSTWSSWREQQLTCGRATQNAIFASLGTVSNMPVVIDEMTNLENHVVGQLIHDLSAGSPKKRCDAGGSLAIRDDRWETIILGSGNLLLGEKLAQHRISGEAERLRIFEYTIDIARSPIEQSEALRLFPLLSEHYGVAGRELARYMVDNYDDVKAQLLATQDKIGAKFQLQRPERYWTVLLASVMTMHAIATKLGLVQFPAAPLVKWMAMTLAANRASVGRSAVQPDTLISMMLADLWQGMLVTQGLGNLYKGWDAYIEQHPRGAISGRVIVPRPGQPGAQDTEAVYIRADAAKAWCNKKGVTAQDVFKGAVAAGLVKAKETRFGTGSGTSQYSGMGAPEPCWEVNYGTMKGMLVPVPSAPHLAIVQSTTVKP